MTFDRKPDGRHRRSKLTDANACQIFWDDHAGMSQADIAAKYGVSASAVKEVLAHRTWADATLETRRELLRLRKARETK